MLQHLIVELQQELTRTDVSLCCKHWLSKSWQSSACARACVTLTASICHLFLLKPAEFLLTRPLPCCATELATCMQVSQAGEVVYAFDRDFVGKIRQRSWLQRLRPLWKRVVNVGSYVARVAFGTALVVSALLVWLAVIAITSSRDDNRCGAALSSRRPLTCYCYSHVQHSVCQAYVT
jgi:hypothetical protein